MSPGVTPGISLTYFPAWPFRLWTSDSEVWFASAARHRIPKRRKNMIRRLLASATHFKTQLAKRLFVRNLVFRREKNSLQVALAYVRIDDERWRRCR
jgi:hypothetical protein